MAFSDLQANCQILDADGVTDVLLAGTVVKGDILGYSSGWVQALATTAGVIQGRCVALESGVAGQRISVAFDQATLGGSRFSGGTAGGALYVAEGTSVGMYTQTLPSTTGDATKIIGYMTTATIAVVRPLANDDSVKAA